MKLIQEATRFIASFLCLSFGVVAGFCWSNVRGAHTPALWDTNTPSDGECSYEAIRINKVFKATHSRRQADDLIATGRVTINGKPADSAGRRVVPFCDVVALDGQTVEGWEALNGCVPQSHVSEETVFEYIKYWKPCGVICTTDRSIKGNILDALETDGYQPNHRIYPVGRLDKDTSGLILLTSDGRLPNSALRGHFKQPKKYDVLVNQPLTNREAQELRDGIVITTQAQRDGKRAEPLTAKTKPCLVQVSRSDRRRLRLTLEEGRNRQIRRMIGALGLHVVALRRYEFMNIGLDPLKGPGEWAHLSPEEMEIVSQVISAAQQQAEQPADEEQAVEGSS